MRWKPLVMAVTLATAGVFGCKQQCYMTECDYQHYRDIGLPQRVECDPSTSIVPSTSHIAAPATVTFPEREIRYLSLSEAIAMGLECGTTGSPSLNGTANLSLASFQGRTVFAPEVGIRVLAYDPAILAADIEASLSKFDVQWVSSLQYTTTDRPVSTAFDVFQTGGSGQTAIQTNDATLSTSLLKPLPTGGVAGITFSTAYELTNLPAPVNPSYRPMLQFQFEQPLLQGFGVEINQLRSTHPGSILTPFSTGGRVEGVLITRLRFDEQRAEFERNVHQLLVNVEVAYWNLYGSYWALYSREQALRQAFEAYKINKERFEAGRIAIQDLAQTRQQYESFRAQRIQALQTVLDNERALRLLIGLPVEDCTRLVPIDSPTLSPYQPDWCTAINEALALRPELVLARNDLKFRQLDLINQKNLLLPDLRFTATYDINGLGNHLDGGSDPNNALHSLATDKFNDWALGLRATVPIGFRDAHSAVRSAHLNLARSYAVLRDQEERTHQFLALEYSNLNAFYELIIAQRAQREAAATQLGARFREFLAGRGTLDFLLEAQRVWADALRDEYAAIVQYNNALITFEFAKGTIMQHDNVVIGEGPLPQCAQIRAVEHARQRSKALVLHERAQPVAHPPICGPDGAISGVPAIPADTAPPVPSLLEGQGQTPAMPEKLPMPTKDTSVDPVSAKGSPASGAQPAFVADRAKSGPAANKTTPVAAPSFKPANGVNPFSQNPITGVPLDDSKEFGSQSSPAVPGVPSAPSALPPLLPPAPAAAPDKTSSADAPPVWRASGK